MFKKHIHIGNFFEKLSLLSNFIPIDEKKLINIPEKKILCIDQDLIFRYRNQNDWYCPISLKCKNDLVDFGVRSLTNGVLIYACL